MQCKMDTKMEVNGSNSSFQKKKRINIDFQKFISMTSDRNSFAF